MGAPSFSAQNHAPALAVGLLGAPSVCASLRGNLTARGHHVVLEHDPRPTSDSEPAGAALAEPDVLVIGAPVTLTRALGADTAGVARAADVVARGLRRGQLVVLTGPVPPGTTRGVLLPRLAPSGLAPGRAFSLAYTPTVGAPDSACVVGGFDPRSAEVARSFFAVRGAVTAVSSLEVAEVCGALAPADQWLRAAAAQELRAACDRMGLDAWEVSRAAGAPALGPALGPAPPDPALLVWGVRRWGAAFPLLERAADGAASAPEYVARKVADVLNDAGRAVRGSRVAVVGIPLPFGTNAGETLAVETSPVLALIELLLLKGSRVCFSDPHVRALAVRPELSREPIARVALTPDLLAEQDCVVVAASGACAPDVLVEHSRRVLDTCGATSAVTCGREKIVRA